MKESQNIVEIAGLLLESKITEGVAKTSGKEYITARLTIRVNIDGVVSEIPVEGFAMKMTKAGKVNPSYTSIQALEEATSLAAAGGNENLASRIHIRNGRLAENMFVDRNSGNVIAYNKVVASFFETKSVPQEDIATFSVTAYVLKADYATDKEGEILDTYKVSTGVVQWGDNLDVVEFTVEKPQAIEFIKGQWNKGSTVGISGNIYCIPETITKKSDADEYGFGEAPEKTFTKVTKKLVITAGTYPKTEGAYDMADIKAALAKRNEKKEQLLAEFKKPQATEDFGF